MARLLDAKPNWPSALGATVVTRDDSGAELVAALGAARVSFVKCGFVDRHGAGDAT